MRLAVFLAALISTSSAFAEEPPLFAVEVSGEGPPVLLIPGLMSSGDVWDETVARLKDRYECHVVTLAGFAGQPPVAERPFLGAVRRELLAYIDKEALARPVVIGHSLGATTALALAATAPGKIGPVVAVDGVPFLSGLYDPAATEETSTTNAGFMAGMMRNAADDAFEAQSRMSMRFLMKSDSHFEEAVGWAMASDRATVGDAMYELMTTDWRDEVAAIESPVLLMMATHQAEGTPMYEPIKAAFAAQAAPIRNARLAEAKDARHFIMYDDPAWFFAELEGFLAQNRAEPAK
ncbi:MAG: alpha/beta hydrolase [Candidatus Sumerlaeia bacterium]|nr:alpha/beta hydrolase [Candidatus Sumerlaeia bacterium]